MKKNSLILLFAFLCLSSCGDTAASPKDTTVQHTPSPVVSETETTDEFNLPVEDFEGYQFTFAVRGDGSGTGAWHSTDLVSDGLNGEVLNDAVFHRTSFIEEKYNVKFDVMWCGETSIALTGSAMSKVINQTILAGDDCIDTILSSPYDTVGYMINDFIIDLKQVENLDLTNPWWDQNANANLSFNDRIYFTTGEITIVDNKCAYSMIFSKRLAEMFDIPSPYDAVRAGSWTMDRMISDAKNVAADLNGDGKMDEFDRYGFLSWQDACFGLIHSMGNTFGIINKAGEPELTFYTERMINSWDKIIDFAKSDGFLALAPDHKFFKATGLTTLEQIMGSFLENDQFLYAFAMTNAILSLRDCSADFGILPLPKYDEAQEHYYSTSHGYGTTLLSIPVIAENTARTGMILEAFAAKSMELVTPAFYDLTLHGKTVRDADSAEMLDIIYGSKIYDIGYFFQWGDLTNKVMNAYNRKDINLSSLYEKSEKKALKDLEDAVEIFSALH
ncbi:MAG: hypothetical protein MJ175_06110 [Clostridia bacterium]|nr:hypothetical protein [Clostridia bacterium]